mmetsp:Transcript_11357/g.11768  ORF Transcript_11357/g.11768 Transcript_11357/m.11768 type:complete len:130 (+) Transcript_11357:89-478(+)
MSFSKEASRILIKYITRIEVGAYYNDAQNKAIFEFARQISGPQLLKSNPKLAIDVKLLDHDSAPYVKAEFINGHKLNLDPISLTCQDIRDELFSEAENIENELDFEGNNPIFGEDDDDGATEAKTTKKK